MEKKATKWTRAMKCVMAASAHNMKHQKVAVGLWKNAQPLCCLQASICQRLAKHGHGERVYVPWCIVSAGIAIIMQNTV